MYRTHRSCRRSQLETLAMILQSGLFAVAVEYRQWIVRASFGIEIGTLLRRGALRKAALSFRVGREIEATIGSPRTLTPAEFEDSRTAFDSFLRFVLWYGRQDARSIRAANSRSRYALIASIRHRSVPDHTRVFSASPTAQSRWYSSLPGECSNHNRVTLVVSKGTNFR